MKLLIELDIEVDGKISEERLRDVIPSHTLKAGPIMSECTGDGENYIIWVNSVEVKEVKS